MLNIETKFDAVQYGQYHNTDMLRKDMMMTSIMINLDTTADNFNELPEYSEYMVGNYFNKYVTCNMLHMYMLHIICITYHTIYYIYQITTNLALFWHWRCSWTGPWNVGIDRGRNSWLSSFICGQSHHFPGKAITQRSNETKTVKFTMYVRDIFDVYTCIALYIAVCYYH